MKPNAAAHDALGRLVEIGALAHDRRVLAAHLDDDRLGKALGEVLVQVEADLERAGEEDAVDARRSSWSSAPTVSPGPMTMLNTPSGMPRVTHHLGEHHAAERGVRRGLVDDRVAGHERAAGRPAGEREREVEGADDRPTRRRA